MINSSRRSFLRKSSLLAGLFVLSPTSSLFAKSNKGLIGSSNPATEAIRLFHTAGLQVPPASGLTSRTGGFKTISDLFLQSESPTLPIDSGGYLTHQPTGSNIDFIRQMNVAGYKVAGLGIEELSDGGEQLKSLIPHMDFSLVNCNYRFDDAELSRIIKPYEIIRYAEYKIGVTGIGPDLGVKGITYRNPIARANSMAEMLKVVHQCDLVVCISNMESANHSKTAFHQTLAQQSSLIDMVLNTPCKTMAPGLLVLKNRDGGDFMVSNVASSGMYLGSYELKLGKDRPIRHFANYSRVPGISNPMLAAGILKELEPQHA